MAKIMRIWSYSENYKEQFTLWDMGNEIWELGCSSSCANSEKNDVIRHFRVLNRKIDSFGNIIEELEVLPESPIPLEAIVQSVDGWKILEEGAQPLPQPALPQQPQQPLPQQPPQVQQKKKNTQRESGGSENSKIKRQDSQTESQQPSYILPTELWSSLSEWIPPNALFQPSLHHQASLELSDIYPSSKEQVPSYQKKFQRQLLSKGANRGSSRVQQTTPGRQQTAFQALVNSGPLFI